MAAAKMAISSRDTTSILYSAQRVAKKVSHSFTSFGNVSDETLDMLVGLCAGHGALLHIQRKQALNLFKRLSASQMQPPTLDDETWAAEVGGGVTGKIKGRRSYLKPWTEPNFGVTFRYRREADDTQGSTEDPRYSIFPHDGSLFGALMRSKTSTLSTRPAACKVDSCPGLSVSSTLPRSPISTPPSNATSKQTSQIPSPIDYSRRLSLITPPTSLSTGNSCEIHDNILDKPNTRQQQVPSKRLKVSPRSNSLLSLLFTEEEYMLNRHNSADHQSNPKKNSKEREWRRAAGGITGLDGKEETGDDSDSCMGSIEVRAMRMQQHQRLERKEFESPVVECQRNAIDRKSNKIPQGRPVIKVGGATRATRVTFREREPTRRGAPVRGVETKVA